MSRKHWHLLAYDIREHKRLRRTWYFVKKKGVGLQRSVFLFRTDASGLDELVDGIKERVRDADDDVRIYPIRHPGSIWAAGIQAEKIKLLYAPVPAPDPNKRDTGLTGLIRTLFSRKKSKKKSRKE